jgi:hypothetical protein
MVKAKTLKRFKGMEAGTVFDCPKKDFQYFHDNGWIELVEIVKETKAPKTKEVKGPEVSK